MLKIDKAGLKEARTGFVNEVFKFPAYVITNPFKAFSDIKYEKKGSVPACVFFAFVLMIVTVLKDAGTGVLFRTSDPHYTNIWSLMIGVVAQTLLIVAANWSVSVLTNGSGSFREIFMVAMYAQYPYIWLNILYIALSHVLTQNEAAFLSACTGFGFVCIAFYGFIGLVSVHGYGFFEGIASVLLTVVALLIILFIVLMLVMMGNECITFVRTVYEEIVLHYF